MICLLKNRVMLIVVFFWTTCSADFSCICSYKVELSVYQQSDKTSTGIGYMYEFDCKPQVLDVEVDNEWFVIMFEKKMGYVEKDPNVVAQVCPGSIPATDMLPTTQTLTLVSSASQSTTTQSTHGPTFTRVTKVSTNTRTTTTVAPKTELTTEARTTVPTTYSGTSNSTSETIATIQVNSVSQVGALPELTSSSTTKPTIGANLPATSSGEFDAKLFREQLELCRSINTSHIMTHTYLTGYCYEFVTYNPRMWALAELHCNARGGHLLSITTGSEDEYIHQIIKTHQHLQNATFWTGLSVHDNSSAWTDGSGIEYVHYIR
ncbi:hypothetical protein DPMN_123077 [Dreissena polymorpha]|uniref:C-type lectin domain-containing protein n=1 Tax=Dreissena polymorpha TaxID=45954 RepID=A0A9D4JSJ9_DREPO|nr:hypothetical protein DPMN_123077 [Dreissena polymorpha]